MKRNLESFSSVDLMQELIERSNPNSSQNYFLQNREVNFLRDDVKDYTNDELYDYLSRRKFIESKDDRKDASTAKHVKFIKRQSVAAIFDKNDEDFTIDSSGAVRVPLESLAKKMLKKEQILCTNERFKDEPSGSRGTAFLITKNIVLTARHCITKEHYHSIKKEHYRNKRLIFGYEKDRDSGNIVTSFSVNEVYKIIDVIPRETDSKKVEDDWVIVYLDRDVEGIEPLVLRTEQEVFKDEGVYTIGHPSGLPKKIADKGIVNATNKSNYFRTTLDIFAGNSGSPIFSENDNKVVGIVVRNGNDYIKVKNCYKSYVCISDECAWSKCIRLNTGSIARMIIKLLG